MNVVCGAFANVHLQRKVLKKKPPYFIYLFLCGALFSLRLSQIFFNEKLQIVN